MKMFEITPRPDWMLAIVSEDGRKGDFDVSPYLHLEAFEELRKISEFMKISNGGYFVEWNCGADLSADTIEAHWKLTDNVSKVAIA